MLQNQDHDKKAACCGSIIFILGTHFIIFGTITRPMLNIVDDKRKQTLGKHGKPITAYYPIPLPIKEGLNQKFILHLAAGENKKKKCSSIRIGLRREAVSVAGSLQAVGAGQGRTSTLLGSSLSQSKEAHLLRKLWLKKSPFMLSGVLFTSKKKIKINKFWFWLQLSMLQISPIIAVGISENLCRQISRNTFLTLRFNCCVTYGWNQVRWKSTRQFIQRPAHDSVCASTWAPVPNYSSCRTVRDRVNVNEPVCEHALFCAFPQRGVFPIIFKILSQIQAFILGTILVTGERAYLV